jgi:hypothetical protein
MVDRRKREEKPVNLLTRQQVLTLIDAVQASAFKVEMRDEDGAKAILSVERELFRVDLVRQQLLRRRDGGSSEVAYRFDVRSGWFSRGEDNAMWRDLGRAITQQIDLGGDPALTTNLVTRTEVRVLIDAIRVMAFRIDPLITNPEIYVLFSEEREVYRIDRKERTLSMIGLKGGPEVIYRFQPEPAEWFWSGTDRQLWKGMVDAIDFYRSTIQRVRMVDYRALFASKMQDVIAALADAMTVAEADSAMLAKVEGTGPGRLHPDVADLLSDEPKEEEGEQG